MKSFSEKLNDYAKLSINVGINLQQNQKIFISAPIESAEFARLLASEAYKAGAKDVYINWVDEKFEHIRFSKAPSEAFESFPKWIADGRKELAQENCAFLSILANDPELMKDIDPKKISSWIKTASIALKDFREYTFNSKISWSIISVPSNAWSNKVFNNDPNSVNLLWDAIFKIVRVDQENPIKAWQDHLLNLKSKKMFLNEKRFEYLFIKSKGTDLKIRLPKNHYWQGGSKENASGVTFVANMPTEEVFTLPDKTGVNGYVTSTKPLNYMGNLIDKIKLEFKDGEIINYSAQSGFDTLKELIETDEGSKFLGEVAFVPFDSPISNMNTIFYNTLFDENASCHLALGRAYPTSIINGSNMTKEQLDKEGVNNSIIHIDFMIGASDTEIIGLQQNGKEVQIFTNGNWAF